MRRHILSSSLLLLLVFSPLIGRAEQPALTGTISLSGAWAIYPLAVKWGEAFRKLHPHVRMDISAGGAGKGMTDVLTGVVDIGMVSREVDPAEKAKGALPIYIAKDAVFATVNTRNPAIGIIQQEGMTLKTLTDIFINGKIGTWKQAVGGPERPLHIYMRSDSCGAASAWAGTLGKYTQADLKGIGVYGDPGLLQAVQRDPLGIGFNNLGFIFNGRSLVKGIALVPIDANKNGKVDPNERIDSRDKAYKEIAAGRYPGTRREYFVTKGAPSGLALAFIKYTMSDAGMKVLNQVGGYVAPSAAERKAQLKKMGLAMK
ncbi:MAG TPA: substrate-binding domain-containing protein [Armatimonadota bacterium]|jgi:phosphate transport system substrate-binding protein